MSPDGAIAGTRTCLGNFGHRTLLTSPDCTNKLHSDTRVAQRLTVGNRIQDKSLHKRGGAEPSTRDGHSRETGRANVVVDQAADKGLTLHMPVAQIPITLDKKTLSDAVLARGEIRLVEVTDE